MSVPQDAFASDRKHSCIAFVGGYGSGKTDAGIARTLSLAWENPGKTIGFYTRTYDLLRVEIRPRFLAILRELGTTFSLEDRYIINITNAARILFRSLDREDKIITYETVHFIIDELDTLRFSKADGLWKKIWGRNRQPTINGGVNTGSITSTPEGYNFLYDRFKTNKKLTDRLIRATTYSNKKHLSESFINNLYNNYPPAWISGYVFGKFTNLATGHVYPYFDRKKNGSDVILKGDETLHIGMDFNVDNMAAVVHVIIEGKAHAVDEIYGLKDTPTMINEILHRYKNHLKKNKVFFLYPDPTGNKRGSTSALSSDFILLKKAQFQNRRVFSIIAPSKSPEIRNQVTTFNNCFEKQKYFINTENAPFLTRCIEKQAYDANGKPEKKNNEDHVIEAARYFAINKFPIQERRKTRPRSQPLHEYLNARHR